MSTVSLKELSAQTLFILNLKKSLEFSYRDFNDFLTHSPHTLWYSWSLTEYHWSQDNTLYLVYRSPVELASRHCVFPVSDADELAVREWLVAQRPVIWRL